MLLLNHRRLIGFLLFIFLLEFLFTFTEGKESERSDTSLAHGGKHNKRRRAGSNFLSRQSRSHFGFPLGEDSPILFVSGNDDHPDNDDETDGSKTSTTTTTEKLAVVKYIGCFDYWPNNTFKTGFINNWSQQWNPFTCSEDCWSKNFELSLLRGAECHCTSITNFHLNPVPDEHCKIPCPIDEMEPGGRAPSPTGSCGGNYWYAMYCRDTTNKRGRACETFEEVLRSTSRKSSAPILSTSSMEEYSPFCGLCSSTPCWDLMGWHDFSTLYDYFPANDPESCRAFCGGSMPYYLPTTQGESVRAPTRYAYLMWDWIIRTRFGDTVPICLCANDISALVKHDRCDTLCPGDPKFTCGKKERDGSVPLGSYFANVYCTNPDCSDPNAPTTTTTLPTSPSTTTTARTTTTTTVPSSTSTTTVTPSTPTTPSTPKQDPTTTIATTSKPPVNTDTDCDVTCSAHEFSHSGRYWTACAGVTEYKVCSEREGDNYEGLASWECGRQGTFLTEQPVYSNCHSKWVDEAEEDVVLVNDTETALGYLQRLHSNLTHRTRGSASYFGHEIRNLVGVLGKVVNQAGNSTDNQERFSRVAEKATTVVETIITNVEPWHQLERGNRSLISTSLLETMEETSFQLTGKIRLSPEPGPSSYYENPLNDRSSAPYFFVLAGVELKGLPPPPDGPEFQFPSKSFPESYLRLPQGWRDVVGETDRIHYVGMYLDARYVNLMMPGQFKSMLPLSPPPVDPASLEEPSSVTEGVSSTPKTVANGKLLSFTIGIDANGDPGSNFSLIRKSKVERFPMKFPSGKGVEVIFNHDLEAWGGSSENIRRKLHPGEEPKAAMGSGRCVFWDMEKGVWSGEGCRMVSTSRHQTVCECSHLTSFAVLMDVHNYLGKQLGLEILTLCLCSFSFICLFTSIVIFSTFHGIQSERNSITKNLSICLLAGNTSVLLLLDRHYLNMTEGFCIAGGIITHYIFLCAFSWMAIEGVHLYRMVVHVFDSENNPLKAYRIFSYGLPLVIVMITASVGFIKGDQPYGGDLYCWLSGSYIWAFLVPVLLVVIENLIMLFIALKTAYQVQYSERKMPSTNSRVRNFRVWLKGCLSLTILLGITWIVGFFTLLPETSAGLVAAYIFVVLNASQGIFIFIFHCLYNDKVRLATHKRLGNYFPSWLSKSSDYYYGSYGSDDNKRDKDSSRSGRDTNQSYSRNPTISAKSGSKKSKSGSSPSKSSRNKRNHNSANIKRDLPPKPEVPVNRESEVGVPSIAVISQSSYGLDTVLRRNPESLFTAVGGHPYPHPRHDKVEGPLNSFGSLKSNASSLATNTNTDENDSQYELIR